VIATLTQFNGDFLINLGHEIFLQVKSLEAPARAPRLPNFALVQRPAQ
jgi:hypothetical protein